MLLPAGGCAIFGHRHWTHLDATSDRVDVKSIDEETPVKIDSAESVETFTIPAKTAITKTADALSVVLPAPVPVCIETRGRQVTGPTHPAPKPPSPEALAAGWALRVAVIGCLACLAAAGLLAWSGHYLAALCLGLAGLAAPALVRFATSNLALAICGALIAAGAAFFFAWLILDKRHGLESAKPAAAPLKPPAPA